MGPGRSGLILATVGALWAQPANAGTFLITYTGFLTDYAYDQTGVFGAADTSLVGEAFTATYRLTWPSPSADYYNDGTHASAQGGATILGGVPAIMSGDITIKGVTQSVTGDYLSSIGRKDEALGPSGGDALHHYVDQYDVFSPSRYRYREMSLGISSHVNNIIDSLDFTGPLNYTRQPGDFSSGLIVFYTYIDGVKTEYAEATGVDVRTVRIVSVAAIPEPATWAMMILGFGVLGAALRWSSRHRLA